MSRLIAVAANSWWSRACAVGITSWSFRFRRWLLGAVTTSGVVVYPHKASSGVYVLSPSDNFCRPLGRAAWTAAEPRVRAFITQGPHGLSVSGAQRHEQGQTKGADGRLVRLRIRS